MLHLPSQPRVAPRIPSNGEQHLNLPLTLHELQADETWASQQIEPGPDRALISATRLEGLREKAKELRVLRAIFIGCSDLLSDVIEITKFTARGSRLASVDLHKRFQATEIRRDELLERYEEERERINIEHLDFESDPERDLHAIKLSSELIQQRVRDQQKVLENLHTFTSKHALFNHIDDSSLTTIVQPLVVALNHLSRQFRSQFTTIYGHEGASKANLARQELLDARDERNIGLPPYRDDPDQRPRLLVLDPRGDRFTELRLTSYSPVHLSSLRKTNYHPVARRAATAI